MTTIDPQAAGLNQGCCQAQQDGTNRFLKKQAAEPSEALVTLLQFDKEDEFVHRGVAR